MTVVWNPLKLIRQVAPTASARGLHSAKLVHCGGECCVVKYINRRHSSVVAVRWCLQDDRRDMESVFVEDARSKIMRKFWPYYVWPLRQRPMLVNAHVSSVTDSHDQSIVSIRGTPMRAYDCDLYDFLARGEATPQFLAKAMHTVAMAVYQMHFAGYAHNDIRLENILVTRGHQSVSIADFGCMAPIGHPIPCDGRISSVENDTVAFVEVAEKINQIVDACSQPGRQP